jgi:hypothetical protein
VWGDGIRLQHILLLLLFQNNEILLKSITIIIIIIYQLNEEGVAANSTPFRTTNPYRLGYLQLITSIINGASKVTFLKTSSAVLIQLVEYTYIFH